VPPRVARRELAGDGGRRGGRLAVRQHTVNLTKNGSTLSGYINLTVTAPFSGVTTTLVVVDSVVAVRVP
jgi:hypothetical protein